MNTSFGRCKAAAVRRAGDYPPAGRLGRWLARAALAGSVLLAGLLASGCRHAATQPPPAATAARLRALEQTPLPVEPSGQGRRQSESVAPTASLPATLPTLAAPLPATPALGVIPVPTARLPQPVGETGPPRTDPEIALLLAQVDAARLGQSASAIMLSAAAGETPGSRLVWLEETWRKLDGSYGNQVVVEREAVASAQAGGVAPYNLIATLPGIGRSKRIVYLSAHWVWSGGGIGTSAAEPVREAALAAVLAEVARLAVQRRWDATIRLAVFAGGVENPVGSRQHAAAAAAIGMPVVAAIDLDVGPRGASGTSSARPIGRLAAADPLDSSSWRLGRTLLVMAPEEGLTLRAVREAEGPRSLTFAAVGYPAVRLTSEVLQPSAAAGRQTTEGAADPDALVAATRSVAGILANLALAPAAPTEAPVIELAAAFPGRVQARWSGAVDPTIAGFWVGWRRDEELEYRELRWVGRESSLLLEMQPPGTELSRAVAASDDRGHLSPFGPEARWRFD